MIDIIMPTLVIIVIYGLFWYSDYAKAAGKDPEEAVVSVVVKDFLILYALMVVLGIVGML